MVSQWHDLTADSGSPLSSDNKRNNTVTAFLTVHSKLTL